jgi:hypothetical protein
MLVVARESPSCDTWTFAARVARFGLTFIKGAQYSNSRSDED